MFLFLVSPVRDTKSPVVRTVVWGYPEIAAACPITARRPPYGERGGNVSEYPRPIDSARLVTKAVVLGRGSGSKQIKGTATNEALLAAGYLPVIRAYSEPTIKKAATATRRAARRLTGSAAQLVVPAPVTMRLAETEAWPQVGDLITLDIAATPADPTAATGYLRAAKVSWTVTAGAVESVTVDGVDQ